MPAQIRHVTIDCENAYGLATFWSHVTGWPLGEDDEPGDGECIVLPPKGNGIAALLFIQVPEHKSIKNRMHLDVGPDDRTRDEEVDRLIKLGATEVESHVRPDGMGWVVLADPEGNEFCVEPSEAERAAFRAARAAAAEARSGI